MNQRVDTGFQSARLHNDVQESAQGDDEHQQIGSIRKAVRNSHNEVFYLGTYNGDVFALIHNIE